MNAKTIAAPMLILSIFLSCTSHKKGTEQLKQVEEEIKKTEAAFSEYSEKNGFANAIAEYAALDAIKLSANQYATIGKERLRQEARADSVGNKRGTITWKPLKIHVAEAGDMAASFGDWFYKFKSRQTSADTILYGNYITIWKKQPDGSWKFLIDGGNATPGPTTDQMTELLKK
jgi:ketosteroid isomerase-like protein